MDKQLEIKEFLAFIVEEAKSKGKDPNQYAKELGEDGLKEAYKRYLAKKQKAKEKEVLKALHGAKLNYFKHLKNQCAEDEEIVYYKKGGSVECGCKKKKMEDGGKAEGTVKRIVDKFKEAFTEAGHQVTGGYFRKKSKAVPLDYSSKKVKQSLEDYENGTYGMSKKEIEKLNKPFKKACGGKASKMKNNLPPKVKEEKCGGAVKKFKKHYNGGKFFFNED